MSIVVIGYNDASHLPTAVLSATGQTIRDLEVVVVDDGSTDATPAVAAQLAAADPRVRSIRLPSNSGGCSRPRNEGLAQANGEYVMFLDSDDVLPRRSVERLLESAARTDADLVCGRYLRRHHNPRRFVAAHEQLYLRPAVLDGVLFRPQQLADTSACSKLYRRSFLAAHGLQFPKGLLYEDLLFTTEAYCTARRIAIVPDLVYIWNVRRRADELSITNRLDLRNWRDRFEVHRRIDAFIAARPDAAELRIAKDAKFLDIDFQMFLRELRAFPEQLRPELLALAADYVTDAQLSWMSGTRTASRVGAFLAGQRDVDRTLSAADYSETEGVNSDLTVRDGRLFWTGAYLDSEPGRTALDVTSTGILGTGFVGTPFLVTASRVQAADGVIHVNGTVHDVLDRLGDAATAKAQLQVVGRLGGRVWSGPVDLRPDGHGWSFSADIDLNAVARRMAKPTVGHEMRLSLAIVRGDQVARRMLSARDADLPPGELPVPKRWRWLLGDRLRVAEVNGRLVLQFVALPAVVDASIQAVSLLRHGARRMLLRRGQPLAT